MGKKEDILNYLLIHGKENKYKLARALRIRVHEVAKILDALENEGKIEIKTGKAGIKGKVTEIKPKIKKKKVKVKKRKLPEMKEESEGKLPESEEIEEEVEVAEEPTEKEEENRIGGTVKFYNQNKGLVCIKGDNEETYYVHKDQLQGTMIEKGNRVSFKVVQGDKGPKAEKVEKISERIEGVH